VKPGRRAYVHVVKGGLLVNGAELKNGDGAKVDRQPDKRAFLTLEAGKAAEVLVFDLE
jgi:quercetin 2,3-dioxygenase